MKMEAQAQSWLRRNQIIRRGVILGILCFITIQGVTSETLDRPFLNAALESEQAGRYAEALQYLRRGLELSPEASDLYTLMARIYEATYQYGAVEAAFSAMAYNRFDAFTMVDAQVIYYRALLRQNRAVEAYEHLRIHGSSAKVLAYPQLLLEAIRIFQKTKNTNRAITLMEQGLARYPADLPLRTLSLESDKDLPATAVLLLDRSSTQDPAYPALLSAWIRRLPPSDERLKRLEELATIQALPDDLVVLWLGEQLRRNSDPAQQGFAEKKAVESMAKANGAWNARALLALKALLKNSPAIEALQMRLSASEVHINRDTNDDGVAEDYFIFQNGRLWQWKHDADQDYRYEAISLWQNHQPSQLDYWDFNANRLWRAEYGDKYPFAMRTQLANGSAIVNFSHESRAMEDRFVDLPAGAMDPLKAIEWVFLPLPYLNQNAIVIASWQIKIQASKQIFQRDTQRKWLQAYNPLDLNNLVYAGLVYDPKIDYFASSDAVSAQYFLSAGQLLYGRSDEDGDGVFDHAYWYDNGILRFGFRVLGAKGEFQVFEDYDQQRLYDVYVDAKGWTYQYNHKSQIALWDFNADQKIDVSELMRGHQSLYNELVTNNSKLFNVLKKPGL